MFAVGTKVTIQDSGSIFGPAIGTVTRYVSGLFPEGAYYVYMAWPVEENVWFDARRVLEATPEEIAEHEQIREETTAPPTLEELEEFKSLTKFLDNSDEF